MEQEQVTELYILIILDGNFWTHLKTSFHCWLSCLLSRPTLIDFWASWGRRNCQQNISCRHGALERFTFKNKQNRFFLLHNGPLLSQASLRCDTGAGDTSICPLLKVASWWERGGGLEGAEMTGTARSVPVFAVALWKLVRCSTWHTWSTVKLLDLISAPLQTYLLSVN